ncbi:MAG TPA: LysM peptidoglycan-binding domain-containing protein [Deltaproteobacteria bacterium]|nr:LysM peptidoglycan-binding domain-containing protein [Deltaproteobacteria bacterium]
MKRKALSFFILLLVLFVLFPSRGFALTGIINIRHWTAPDNSRIVIDTTSEASYAILKDGEKLIVDIFQSELLPDVSSEYLIGMPAVSKITVKEVDKNTTRLEIDLAKNVSTSVFNLGEILDKPHRIVIDLSMPEIERQETDERIRIGVEGKKRIIVLDPGHGGEDPGAIGLLGTQEKDIVLQIARELRELLVERGYKIFMTRDGDYFVSLEQRGRIARQYNADLFISIHADAATTRQARGSSVYSLSTIAASDEASRLLAASQNLSDIIGGDPDSNNNFEVDPILLNMLQTEALNKARSFGSTSLEMLKRVNDLKFNTVQGAPFRVLRLPDIPAILVETAYLSNPQEELLLRSKAFRRDIAWAVAAAVTQYMPIPSSLAFLEKDAQYRPQSHAVALGKKDIIYKVKRGDNLETIAADHGTTVRTLMEANKIKSKNRIYAGQSLKIPGGYIVDETDTTPAVYTVASGDTLERVARRYGVSMADLMRINNIQSKDRIYIGQRLALAPPSSAPSRPAAHVIARGETLGEIALQYGITTAQLMRMNNIKAPDRIFAGQKLSLSESPSSPRAETHVVTRGDTLERIARRYDMTVEELMRLNNIQSQNRIYIDQKIALSAPPSASPFPARSATTYVVLPGDTLGGIAQKNDLTVAELMRLNNIKSQDRIYAGQRLVLADTSAESPARPEKHVVTSGEALEQIARRYDVTVADLMEANNLQSRDRIYVGQKISIPENLGAGAGNAKATEQIYTVGRGDTLEGIAKRFNTTIESLMAANNLESSNLIFAGQKIIISQ